MSLRGRSNHLHWGGGFGISDHVIARSLIDQGPSHEIDPDEIDQDVAISTVDLAI
jgi:hypothetical protein